MRKRAFISEAKFRQLIRYFEHDLDANTIASLSRLNRDTVNRYRTLIRKRIADLCDLRLAELLKDIFWTSLYGTAAICGIGFTMSLFIASLAFEETGVNLMFNERLGIILGSLASDILGYLILRTSLGSIN